MVKRHHWSAVLLTVACVVLFVLIVQVSRAEAYPHAVSAGPPEGCDSTYTRADFHRIAGRAYDGRNRATRFERRTLTRVRRCQTRPGRSARLIRVHSGRYRRAHRYRRAVAAVTPYGRWAIPEYIVACESGGSWSAYNPSGAVGPYQLLGKGAPFPANTRAARLEHHRIAYRLWNGGAGASHWVCA